MSKRQRAPLWMRTILRLWPGPRAPKKDDYVVSDDRLREIIDETDALPSFLRRRKP